MLTCVICEADRRITFAITDTTQDNTKLLEQLKSGFKRRINWNKDQYKVQHRHNINIKIN